MKADHEEIQCFKPVPVEQIPGFGFLTPGFWWVQRFLFLKETQKRLEGLKKEQERLKEIPRCTKEFRAAVLAEYDHQKDQALEDLAQHLSRHTAPGQESTALNWPGRPLVDRKFLESALDRLPEGGMDSEQRHKELERLGREIFTAEISLPSLPSPGFIGEPIPGEPHDLRERFVQHWRRVQAQCNGPCGPTGEALADGSETDAWQALGLAECVNPEAIFCPACCKAAGPSCPEDLEPPSAHGGSSRWEGPGSASGQVPARARHVDPAGRSRRAGTLRP